MKGQYRDEDLPSMEVALPIRRAALREGAEDEDGHDG